MDAKSGYFLSGDVKRSSPVLYCEYCIENGNVVPRYSQGRCMLCCQYSQGSPGYLSESGYVSDTCEVEIFESGKNKWWIQKYSDTCGRGLINW